MIVALALACTGPLPDDERVLPTLTAPEITAFTLACDVEDAEWQLDATATSWTGGGELWWSEDGDYVEDHVVRSRSVEPDGSRDDLRAVLGIEADWRDVSFGSSTAFTCTDAPSLRFVVYDTDHVVTDCVFDGDPSVWDGQPDVPPCDRLVPADTDAP